MAKELISFEEIEKRIYQVRNKKVMLDSDLAKLYGVETRSLNQAVSRNKERFPENFMFSLSISEERSLISQFVTSNEQNKTQSGKRGGRRKPVKVFTEHGILMLANVLRSKQAIKVSIQIIEAFIKLREKLTALDKANLRFEAIEKRLSEHDEAFEVLDKAILPLLESPEPPKRKIGFQPDKKKKKDRKK
ncbi:MAG: ORF6N domain-containing protein [Candidatus Rifleibacteriota bacterium]